MVAAPELTLTSTLVTWFPLIGLASGGGGGSGASGAIETLGLSGTLGLPRMELVSRVVLERGGGFGLLGFKPEKAGLIFKQPIQHV